MNAVVEITAAITALYCAIRTGIAVVGTILVSVRSRRYEPDIEHDSTVEHYETGFSIAVSGAQSVDEIRRRLSMDYGAFEVIVVGDFDSSTAMDEVLQNYRMVRMRLRDEEMERCGHIEIYRSRQKRYRRLIVANRAAASNVERFDCATAIASYDKIIRLDADTFLLDDALRKFSAAMGSSCRRRIVGSAVRTADSAIDRAVGTLFSAAIPFCGRIIEAVDRNDLISPAGHRRRTALFPGSVGTVAETTSTVRHRPRGGRVATVVALLWIMLTGMAFAEGQSGETELLLLSLLCLYTAYAVSGILALAVVETGQNGVERGTISKITPKMLILYPFKHLWDTIKRW